MGGDSARSAHISLPAQACFSPRTMVSPRHHASSHLPKYLCHLQDLEVTVHADQKPSSCVSQHKPIEYMRVATYCSTSRHCSCTFPRWPLLCVTSGANSGPLQSRSGRRGWFRAAAHHLWDEKRERCPSTEDLRPFLAGSFGCKVTGRQGCMSCARHSGVKALAAFILPASLLSPVNAVLIGLTN